MPGLLQKFEISSDTNEQLALVLALPFKWDSKGANFYLTGTTKEGFDWIEFLPFDSSGHATPLPYPLDTPERLYSFVEGWLSHAKRGLEYDTDGDVRGGWLVDRGSCFYSICRVQAEWIIYGK